ncbi:TonB-dependent receptor plug domain-containing protein [Vibrio penaeicida]|uniref:TonB-dependent receptor-like beta-barrel domain-containing protein n=1 Tax=Vibrio penaeicida TaxID=104609 RepID=A0AAV5NL39_9VIBR|nr:TonB-dependent receptor [Vibrio penaeicida]GLQ70964.1 hypothetical protein GCM10007932_03240 [Vibrio penaeicida]
MDESTHQDDLSTIYYDQTREAQSVTHQAEIQVDAPIGESQVLTVGLLSSVDTLEQKNNGTIEVDKAKSQRHEFYVQDDIFITDNLELLPGFRVQNDADFGVKFTPKLNALYTPAHFNEKNLKIRAGVGSGYRVPNLKERFYEFDHSAIGYKVLGNKELTPESSVSYQLGAEWNLHQNVNAHINLFRNDIKDLIATDLNKEKSRSDLKIYEYTNYQKVKTQGVESALNFTLSQVLSGEFAYNYLEARDLLTDTVIPDRPKHTYIASLNYLIPLLKTEVSLSGKYQSSEFKDSDNTITSPAHTSADLKLNTEINNQFKIFFGINNLTDNVRNTPSNGLDNRPTKGRYFYAGLQIKG